MAATATRPVLTRPRASPTAWFAAVSTDAEERTPSSSSMRGRGGHSQGVSAGRPSHSATVPPRASEPPSARFGGATGATSFILAGSLLKMFFSKETLNALYPKLADPLAIAWRSDHNEALDQGMKFEMSYRSPSIFGTDLFNVDEFGCYPGKFPPTGPRPKHGPAGPPVNYGKKWWKHPEFRFTVNAGLIGVHLEDLTTGEVRWDAVYNLHRTSKLQAYAYPIGGSHPFFAPDWCPAPNDALAHRFLLRINNLSKVPSPFTEEIGRIYFTQYGPTQLANTYQYEAEKVGPATSGKGSWSRLKRVMQLAQRQKF